MTEIKRYQCDLCGITYSSKEAAEECEESHERPMELIKDFRKCYKSESSKYPDRLKIRMEDGAVFEFCKYRFIDSWGDGDGKEACEHAG